MSSGSGIAPFGDKRRGLLLVLSSPSGAGKTSLTRSLLQRDARVRISVSVTTRARRPAETDGVDYRFVDEATFLRMVESGGFLEHARVFGNWYGTPKAPIEGMLGAGTDVVADVDWQGTQQLRLHYRQDVVSVFILPPSMAELERRLRARAQDDEAIVGSRMAKANDEMSHWPEYDYVIVNDDLGDTVALVSEILMVERLRRERQLGLADFVNRLRGGV